MLADCWEPLDEPFSYSYAENHLQGERTVSYNAHGQCPNDKLADTG